MSGYTGSGASDHQIQILLPVGPEVADLVVHPDDDLGLCRVTPEHGARGEQVHEDDPASDLAVEIGA